MDYLKEYLTEEKLKIILETQYSKYNWIHNKTVPNSNIKNRPDFRSDEFKIIIEFDGHQHYTQSKVILTDIVKDKVYTDMDYSIFRIPYFVQWCDNIQEIIFGSNYKSLNQVYPHGFIDKNVVLPADYCSLGIKRFENDLKRYNFCYEEIKESLDNLLKLKNLLEVYY